VHVPESGNEVLPEIRKAYSNVWVRKLYRLGAPLYQAAKGITPPGGGFNPPDLDVDAFYDLRRDSEGVPTNRAARRRARRAPRRASRASG